MKEEIEKDKEKDCLNIIGEMCCQVIKDIAEKLQLIFFYIQRRLL